MKKLLKDEFVITAAIAIGVFAAIGLLIFAIITVFEIVLFFASMLAVMTPTLLFMFSIKNINEG